MLYIPIAITFILSFPVRYCVAQRAVVKGIVIEDTSVNPIEFSAVSPS